MRFIQFSCRKCLFTFLLPFISFLPVFGQLDTGYIKLNKSPENVQLVLDVEQPTIGQIKTITRLSWNYHNTNVDTCLLLAKRAVALSQKKYPTHIVYPDAILQLGDAYRGIDSLVIAESLYVKAQGIYQELKLKSKLAKVASKLGAINITYGDYEKAMEYHLSALKVYEESKDTGNIFRPYIDISHVFYLMGRKDKAYEYNAKALKIAEIVDLPGVKIVTTGNQGILEKEMGERYNNIADTIASNSQLYRDSAALFFKKSMDSYEYALSLNISKYGQIELLNNMTELKTVTGNYEEAIQYGKRAEQIAIELKMKSKRLQNNIILAQAYLGAGKPKMAARYSEEGLVLATGTNLGLERSQLNENLYAAYKQLGQHQKALLSYEALKDYQEGIKEEAQKKAVAAIEAKYQNVQKEKQLLAQKTDIMELETANTKIEKQRNYLFGGTVLLGIFGFLGFYFNKIRKERNDKIAFAEALIFAQEEERKRIARDLHDGVGQSLLLIKKQLTSTHEVSTENQQLITDTLEEVRAISQDLHPFQLEKFGLTAAISEMLHKVEKSTDLFISKEIDTIDKILDEKAEINLFRTIQEALNNIVKHSGATAAKVTIQKVANAMIVNVQDNGKGFDHELAIVTSKSLGLRTMYERISAIGGKLKIEKGQPKGTMIRIQIPV